MRERNIANWPPIYIDRIKSPTRLTMLSIRRGIEAESTSALSSRHGNSRPRDDMAKLSPYDAGTAIYQMRYRRRCLRGASHRQAERGAINNRRRQSRPACWLARRNRRCLAIGEATRPKYHHFTTSYLHRSVKLLAACFMLMLSPRRRNFEFTSRAI